MIYDVSYLNLQGTGKDSLLLRENAKSDIEMLDKATEKAKKKGFLAITIYRGYMVKGERRWKTIVENRKV